MRLNRAKGFLQGVAATLGVPIGTVMSRLVSRAKITEKGTAGDRRELRNSEKGKTT